jgi:penicillin-binding protein 2
MAVIHAPPKPRLDARLIAFIILLFVSLAGLFLRLWFLQVVRAEELAQRADAFRLSTVQRLAPRGLIEDRHGRLVAGVRSEIVITAVPDEVRKNPWVVAKLSQMLDVPERKLQEKIDEAKWRAYLASPIHVGVPVEIAARIAEAGDDLPGIHVETQPMRTYPNTTDLAHILGYVWTPSKEDVERLEGMRLKAPDYVGKLGLEYVYERELMGKPGAESIEVDARRRPVRILGRESPHPGTKLILAIDRDLQKHAMELLGGRKGAIVALDPRNGDVLALASSPTYDTSLFSRGISRADYNRLREDPDRPQINRAIAGAYSPGSTFKIVTALAALEAGLFDPQARVHCPGYYQVGERRVRCMGRHGSIAYREAMIHSCNTYFADMAFRTKKDILRQTALRCGLGTRTGIDLRGESRAVVPTDEWLREVRKLSPDQTPPWYPGDTVNLGIGQGALTATPLQMASVIALVANDGVSYRPRLVRATAEPDLDSQTKLLAPEKLTEVQASPAVWAAIKESLVGVVERGTGRRAIIPGLRWGGKTGSTQHSGQSSKAHSWFVGFAPAENPTIAIAVLMEEAGHGGEVAAPIAASVVRRYLALDNSDSTSAAVPRKRRSASSAQRAPSLSASER